MTGCIVEAIDLTKDYGGAVGLDGLDLQVERGEVLGFLGPNGAGKTTAIRLLLDLIRPTRGSARLFGQAPSDPEVRQRIGYLPGELALDDRLTGQQMLDFLGALRRHGQAVDPHYQDELCERLRLTGRDRQRLLRDDSRGTKQKIGLVAAFQHAPDLLILDEPTTGLDPLVREGFFELLRDSAAAGRTVFHSSHVISEVDRTCSRVAILRDGRLVAVERIDKLRQSLIRRMRIQFEGPVPVAALRIPGVALIEQQGQHAVLEVDGDPNPVLRVLAAHPVRYLAFPEPDLDDAFREHYAGDDRS